MSDQEAIIEFAADLLPVLEKHAETFLILRENHAGIGCGEKLKEALILQAASRHPVNDKAVLAISNLAGVSCSGCRKNGF